jgi:mannose-6-phosphate isomerase
MANNIAALCRNHFIDRKTGAMREYFAADWSPAQGIDGRIVEPGHHYEWAFLLDRWTKITGRAASTAVSRLIEFADSRGIDPRRGVAVNAILHDGGVHDPVARLWPQCERLRVYLMERRAGGGRSVEEATQGLMRFLGTETRGLWFDQLGADGQFVVEPARATNLYHIMGVVAELCVVSDA